MHEVYNGIFLSHILWLNILVGAIAKYNPSIKCHWGWVNKKRLDFYEMMKPKKKIGIFETYFYSLSLVTFQPTYIPK